VSVSRRQWLRRFINPLDGGLGDERGADRSDRSDGGSGGNGSTHASPEEARSEPVPAEVRRDAPIRPPGAQSEAHFLARCTGCGECVVICPHKAIYSVRHSADRELRMPIMKPDERPCHMCDDMPCIASCPDGALLPTEPSAVDLGYVEVLTDRCFTFRGPECGACGVCPLETPALRFERNRPVVDSDRCVGCGMCIDACVVQEKAIALRRTGVQA